MFYLNASRKEQIHSIDHSKTTFLQGNELEQNVLVRSPKEVDWQNMEIA